VFGTNLGPQNFPEQNVVNDIGFPKSPDINIIEFQKVKELALLQKNKKSQPRNHV